MRPPVDESDTLPHAEFDQVMLPHGNGNITFTPLEFLHRPVQENGTIQIADNTSKALVLNLDLDVRDKVAFTHVIYRQAETTGLSNE